MVVDTYTLQKRLRAQENGLKNRMMKHNDTVYNDET